MKNDINERTEAPPEENKKRRPGKKAHSFLPYWGIIAEAACVPLFFLGLLIFGIGPDFLSLLAMLLVIAAICAPIFGMAAGIATLARGRKNCSTGGFVVAIIDIIIPPLAVIVIILLFSLDVIVISLM